MSRLEYLRLKLYEVIELGDLDKILRISQELDEVILHYTKANMYDSKKTA